MSHSTSKSDPRSDALHSGASCVPAELGPNMPKGVPNLSKKHLGSSRRDLLALWRVCICVCACSWYPPHLRVGSG